MLHLSNNNKSSQITFLLNDAGETKALIPVMQKLDSVGVNYSILAESTAKKILKDNSHLSPLPNDIAILEKTDPAAANQAKFKLSQAINATCVVSGLASSFQKHWIDWYKNMGKTVVGYYDNFGFNTLRNKAEEFAGSLNALITPSNDTANFFRQRFRNIPVLALGQPILEATSRLAKSVNLDALANILGLDKNKPTILFAGGYGYGYEEAFSLFCQSVKPFTQSNILVAIHPKTTGELEAKLIKLYGLQNQIKIIPKTIDTSLVMEKANVIMSQNSTISTQACLQGKKVLLIGNTTNYERYEFNPLIHYGFTSRYKTVFELSNALHNALLTNQNPYVRPSDAGRLQWMLGIPKFSTDMIARYLMDIIRFNTIKSSKAA